VSHESTGAPPSPQAAPADSAPRPAAGWRLWAVTVGGSGLSPVAPGTAGSLLTVLILAAIWWAFPAALGQTPDFWTWNAILISGVLLFSALCVALGPWTAAHFGRKDPGACVLDEAAGICLTALFLPILPSWKQAWVFLAIFAAFRLFDILKPPPANHLEKLPQGWGILLDDLMAAVYANIVCQVVLRMLI